MARYMSASIFTFPAFTMQVLEQLNVFAEEDIDSAAEALNDVSSISRYLNFKLDNKKYGVVF